jgi:hypothetical protein
VLRKKNKDDAQGKDGSDSSDEFGEGSDVVSEGEASARLKCKLKNKMEMAGLRWR